MFCVGFFLSFFLFFLRTIIKEMMGGMSSSKIHIRIMALDSNIIIISLMVMHRQTNRHRDRENGFKAQRHLVVYSFLLFSALLQPTVGELIRQAAVGQAAGSQADRQSGRLAHTHSYIHTHTPGSMILSL